MADIDFLTITGGIYMSKMKKLWLVMVVLGLFFGLSACKTKPNKGDLVTVNVAMYQESKIFEGTFEISENSSVYELLVEFFDGNYSEFVMEGETVYMLNTLKYKTYALEPADKQYIAFYVNGTSSMKGISQYYIQENDLIEFKLESY